MIEVDAATYSKVEQVRELTESLKYGPARDRYKVVVIDEIHRLSRQAFDALLKIVEEPPPHLVFIFATTEIDAVPATILSRCQEYHFRRVRPALLTAHLRMLADSEEIEASETALRLIARAGEGSVRDSVALLDQLATLGSGTVADEDAARVLGGVGATLHHRLLGSILEGASAEVSAIVAEIEQEGWDPRHVYGEFLTYCRDALHLALGTEIDDIELPEDDAERLAKLVDVTSYENLLRLLHQLLGSEAAVRRSEAGTLAVEIAWLRAAELPKLTRIEALLTGGGPAGSKTAQHATRRAVESPVRSGPPHDDADSGKSSRRRATALETAASGDPPAATVPDADAGSGEGQGSEIERFLVEISRQRQPLAAHLQETRRLEFRNGRLDIFTAPSDPWLATALSRGNNRKVLEQGLHKVWGEDATWRLLEDESVAHGATEGATTQKDDPALKHPVVQTALDIFGGTARAIDIEDPKEIG